MAPISINYCFVKIPNPKFYRFEAIVSKANPAACIHCRRDPRLAVYMRRCAVSLSRKGNVLDGYYLSGPNEAARHKVRPIIKIMLLTEQKATEVLSTCK